MIIEEMPSFGKVDDNEFHSWVKAYMNYPED